MPKYFATQYEQYEVSSANFDHFVEIIGRDERNWELSKQEVIVLALHRLSVMVNGLYYHVDSFFSEDRREPLGEWDAICEFSPDEPHAAFLERVARSINALSITTFLTGCRLEKAVRHRSVGKDAPKAKSLG